MSADRGPLAGVRSLLLPTPAQTALLRAALLRGDAGRDAWARWEREHGGAATVLAGPRDGVKRLLPLLADADTALAVDLAAPVRTCLRTARLRESVRAGTVDAFGRPALAALVEAEIPFAVLPGLSLAHTVYREPGLRHCHDLDLLVDPARLDAAAAAIRRAGFAPQPPTTGPLAPAAVGAHESGLPIALHVRLTGWPMAGAVEAEVLRRTARHAVAGRETPVLAADDALHQVCVHAAISPGRRTLTWVADAWHLVDRVPDLDWVRLRETAAAAGVVLPLITALRYLADELAAPVPESLLDDLAADAADPSRVAAESIFFAASAGPRGTLPALAKRVHGGSEWRAMLRWLLLPSPALLRWRYGATRAGRAPLGYAWRLVDGTIGRIRSRWRVHSAPPTVRPEFMADLDPGPREATSRRAA